jgi:hypothetical protein
VWRSFQFWLQEKPWRGRTFFILIVALNACAFYYNYSRAPVYAFFDLLFVLFGIYFLFTTW